jgi:hypothetical protein
MMRGDDVMRLWREQGIVWTALLALSTSSLAASISLAPLDNDPAHATVLVVGDLLPGDDIAFRTHVGRLTKAIVAFNSDGGDLLAGITIGKTIRLKSFATAVLDGQRCASACAIAWLGGSPRLMARTRILVSMRPSLSAGVEHRKVVLGFVIMRENFVVLTSQNSGR